MNRLHTIDGSSGVIWSIFGIPAVNQVLCKSVLWRVYFYHLCTRGGDWGSREGKNICLKSHKELFSEPGLGLSPLGNRPFAYREHCLESRRFIWASSVSVGNHRCYTEEIYIWPLCSPMKGPVIYWDGADLCHILAKALPSSPGTGSISCYQKTCGGFGYLLLESQ